MHGIGEGRQQHWQLRLHNEIGKERCADDDDEQERAGDHRALDGLGQLCPVQATAQETQHDGTEGADGGGLGWAEDAAVNAADGCDEEQQELPGLAHGVEALAPGDVRDGRRIVRPQMRDHERHGDIDGGEDETRDEGGREKLRHALLRDRRIDHEDDRGRNENAKAAAGRDRARGEAVVIAGLAHFRQGDAGHRRGGGDRGAADGTKTGGCENGCNRQAATDARQAHARGVEEIGREPRARGDITHQDEQRDHRERIGGGCVEGIGAQNCERRLPAADNRIADDTDQHQGRPDRHAQEEKCEEREDAAGADPLMAHIRSPPCDVITGLASAPSAQKSVQARPAMATVHRSQSFSPSSSLRSP